MIVLEVPQGIIPADVVGRTMAEFTGPCVVREVAENARPPWGTSWFREGEDGTLVFWKENWDTSD